MKHPSDPEFAVLEELRLLNGLLEHRVRLAICVLLSKHDALSFSRFREILGETDGSLGAHLRKLEDAGYLDADRTYLKRRPVTWYRLSADGRLKLKQHLEALTQLFNQAL